MAGLIKPVKIGEELINGKDTDKDAYYIIKESYDILTALFSGRMNANDLVTLATEAGKPIENAIMAKTLQVTASKIILL